MSSSPTLNSYMDTMKAAIKLYLPMGNDKVIDDALKYSIKKRYKSNPASIENNYTKEVKNETLLKITDYILDKKPIVTAYGVLFERHGTVPNPLKEIIDMFLESRSIYKKKMFTYPKGSEDFEYYNLLQALAKVDANGRNIVNFK